MIDRMGISVWIVTGDNRATAEAVAATVGIGRGKVMAGVLPADKARKVRGSVGKKLNRCMLKSSFFGTYLQSSRKQLGLDCLLILPVRVLVLSLIHI